MAERPVASSADGNPEADTFRLPKPKTKYGLVWQPMDARAIVEHRKAGRGVFIDFTANW